MAVTMAPLNSAILKVSSTMTNPMPNPYIANCPTAASRPEVAKAEPTTARKIGNVQLRDASP